MTEHYSKKISTPVGLLTLVANTNALVAIAWEHEEPTKPAGLAGHQTVKSHPVLDETAKQLKEYFAGKRTTFDLKLHFGGTDFQNQVWRALQEIPYGKTTSYLDIARKVGSPKAYRAAGSANGQNPLPIVIPCHRVIAANGGLGGFGGGLKNKKFLIELEEKLGKRT